jgi:hypothetical protein
MKLHHGLAIGALLLAGSARAGDGSTPSTIAHTGLILIPGIAEARVIESNAALVAVTQNDANAVGNPEGITLIRGGNHTIQRPAAGKQLDLVRAVGDAAGNVFVVYTSPNEQFGLRPITRRIKPDNTLGFDKVYNVERLAGIAPTNDGGVYLASHVPYNLPGEFLTTMTHLRVYRLSPSGDVTWQVEAAGQKQPLGASEFATTATADANGVFVGYGVGDGAQPAGLIPVIGHRQASDGAELFTHVGLKKPGAGNVAVVAPGSMGTTPIKGLVDEIVIGSDGSAIGAVDASNNEQFIVRVDASGNQTESFACSGSPERFAAHEMACVRLSGKLAVTRFGVVNGHLAILSNWSIDPPAGITQTAWAALPAGRVLVAGLKDGKASLRMYSSSGTQMAAWASPSDGSIGELGALAGTWLGYGSATAPNWLRTKGTYTIGGAPLPVSKAVPTNARPLPH